MDIKLADYNYLEVVKEVEFGLYLDGGDAGEILLPNRYVPKDTQVGDWLNVFLYLDNEERLIATTIMPFVKAGEFACLEVAWVNQFGAFLDWGLMKDLFVPFSEQKIKMQAGNEYIVHVHIDEQSYRIVASAKVEKYLSKEMPAYNPGDEVEILIWQKTDLGFKAIVDDKFGGLLYDTEIFKNLITGMKLTAYIKQVREDGKIDLILTKPGVETVINFSGELLTYIKAHDGFIPFTDKSDATLIYDNFGVSKKVFKKAVGDLYRKRLIEIKEDGLYLVQG